MRVLFLSTNTAMAAAVRYRALQYFPHLRARGIEAHHQALFDDGLDRTAYTTGRRAEKTVRLAVRSAVRAVEVLRAYRYDAVVILREAFLIGPPLLEALLRLEGRPIVFDIDDAVWEGYDSPTYGRWARWVKCSWKTGPTLAMSDLVTAGNSYVAAYAKTRARRVEVLPTVVDTARYVPKSERTAGPPVLGWIGSHSTLQYLRMITPALERLARSRRFRLRVIGAGRALEIPGVAVENVSWSQATEIDEVRGFDIGLFPVVDDPWSRGKSGFKAIQYGAVGIPTVASPVTTNREIVVDGVTGILANDLDAWHDALATLIDDVALRERFGGAARDRIVSTYSLNVHAPRFADMLTSLVDVTERASAPRARQGYR